MGDHHLLLQHAEGRGGDDGHQRQRRVLQHDVHRVGVDDLHLLDVRDVLPGLVLDVELPGEGEADILGGHRLAGGELHVGAQLQPHRLAVRLVGPLGGQRRLQVDRIARVEGDHPVIGGMGRQRVGILVDAHRVEAGGIADIQRDDQGPAPLGTLRCGRAGALQHGRQQAACAQDHESAAVEGRFCRRGFVGTGAGGVCVFDGHRNSSLGEALSGFIAQLPRDGQRPSLAEGGPVRGVASLAQ